MAKAESVTLSDESILAISSTLSLSLRIIICDTDGKAIEGYDSGVLFGNSTSRNVDFEKPLSELADKEVKLRFVMKDADVYSVCCDI